MHVVVELAIQEVVPIVQAGMHLMPAMRGKFSDMVQGQLHAFVKWVTAVMETYCYPQREVGEYSEY